MTQSDIVAGEEKRLKKTAIPSVWILYSWMFWVGLVVPVGQLDCQIALSRSYLKIATYILILIDNLGIF